MYLAIFISLAILSLALLLISFAIKKRTAFFSVVSIVTAAACVAGSILSVQQERKPIDSEKSEQIYIAARLAQDGHYLEAIQAAGEVVRDHGRDDEVDIIRALCLNLTSQFSVCVRTEGGSSNQQVLDIIEFSLLQQVVEDSFAQSIVGDILSNIQFSSQKEDQLDMIMRLRYIPNSNVDFDATGIDGNTALDLVAKARSSSESGEYEQAYQLAQSMAEQGSLEHIILVADMFVNNYNYYSFSTSDEEMDTLLQRMTTLQTELDRYLIQMGDVPDGVGQEETEPDRSSTGDIDGSESDADVEYEMLVAELNEASAELEKAPVKRAINYMLANAPENAEEILAYNLQMAKLYILSEEFPKADKCLDRVFNGTLLNADQWLGVETMMVLDAFKRFDNNPAETDFDLYFSILFTCLNQGVVVEQDGFRYTMQEYLIDYLRNLFSGLFIGSINLAGFPQIQANISYYDENEEDESRILTAEDFSIFDMYEEITDFAVEKVESNGLNICFVVDRSGSMQGRPLQEAKSAVQNFITSMQDEENIRFSLVSFESAASIVTFPTDNVSVIRGGVANLQTTGGTNIMAGLEKGLECLQTETGDRIIILLSDGYDGNSDMVRLNALLGSIKSQDIPVYTIGLDGADHEYLSHMSSSTGGTHTNAANSDELTKVYEQVRRLILNRYTISFAAVTQIDNEDRILRVSLTEKPVYDEKQYSLGSTSQALTDEALLGPQANYYRETGGSNKEAS